MFRNKVNGIKGKVDERTVTLYDGKDFTYQLQMEINELTSSIPFANVYHGTSSSRINFEVSFGISCELYVEIDPKSWESKQFLTEDYEAKIIPLEVKTRINWPSIGGVDIANAQVHKRLVEVAIDIAATLESILSEFKNNIFNVRIVEQEAV